MDGKLLLIHDNGINDLIKYWNENKNEKNTILLIYSYLITQVNIHICSNPTHLTIDEIETITGSDLTCVSLHKLWLKLLYKYIDKTSLYRALLVILTSKP